MTRSSWWHLVHQYGVSVRGRQWNRGWAPAVLALCAALVMISGEIVPGLRHVPAAVWVTATLVLVAALVAALRRGRGR